VDCVLLAVKQIWLFVLGHWFKLSILGRKVKLLKKSLFFLKCNVCTGEWKMHETTTISGPDFVIKVCESCNMCELIV
jgi:MinD superfamily P-loop ATPase